MKTWKKVLLVILAILLLQLIIGVLYAGAEPTGLKVAVVEKPYNVTVVFSDVNLTKAVAGHCENYTGVVEKEVFGENNPAVGKLLSCGVTEDGKLFYTFRIRNDFILRLNSTLVQSPIPLAGKFAIAVIPSVKVVSNGTEFLYIYKGRTTQFVGDHTPKVVYQVLPLYDPEKTFYVLPTDDGKAVIVLPDKFNRGNIEITGSVERKAGDGYSYVTGVPQKITAKTSGLKVYIVYDKNCYKVYAVKNGDVYVQKTRSDCNSVPSPAVSYYDGVKNVVFLFTPSDKVWYELVEMMILLTLTVVLAVWLKTRVEIVEEKRD